MKKNQQKLGEIYSEENPNAEAEKKVLILARTRPKKNEDQTIRNSEQYVSRYQYNIKNLDKYIQLCPHCKKPTLSAFERSVIDSAVDYLNGKRMFQGYQIKRGNFLPALTLFLGIGTAIYFLLNYFITFIRT